MRIRHTNEVIALDPVVVVLATLDTKGAEAAFLARCLAERGLRPWLVDIGLRGLPSVVADISREAVVAAADPAAGFGIPDEREQAMAIAANGAGNFLAALHAAHDLVGVIGIGGSKGTWVATAAMRKLPWGIPKVMIASTVAGDLRRYTGHRDIAFLPAIVDLAGLNAMTRLVLARGAAALSGMAEVVPEANGRGRTVALSMAGVVTPLGQRVQAALDRRGVDVVVFPANGAGGLAMEEAIAAGAFDAVVDIALLELANELLGGVCAAGPDRLGAAARAGLPQVVVPGAIDFANFAGPLTVPSQLEERPRVEHTPAITLVRVTDAEGAILGVQVADMLNQATGPVEILVPLAGFSAYDQRGGAFFDPDADRAFISALRNRLNGRVILRELDLHVNDLAFAEAVIEAAERLIPTEVPA